jgi:hypothetical protein
MKIKFSELTKSKQAEIKSILNGNGLNVKDVNIFQDGEKIALEVKSTGKIVMI